MPLDGTSTETTPLRRLIEALRHDTEWEWNFCRSSGCAIGMARSIWGNVNLYDLLGMTGGQYHDIFGFIDSCQNNIDRGLDPEWSDFYGMPRGDVTPAMVADALERVA